MTTTSDDAMRSAPSGTDPDARSPATAATGDAGARAGAEATLAELVRETLVERRRARRWRIGLRLLTLAWLTAAVGALIVRPGVDDGPGGRTLFGADAGGDGHTALVRVEGVIAPDGPASLEPVARALAAAFDDEGTRAVVLGIDSPGGSPVQSALVYDEIVRQRALHPEVPVHAVLGDVAASGGYFVASAADTIHANGATLVGSIGVRLDAFGATEALERLGIERRSLTAGEHKGLLDPFAPTDPVALARLQTMIDGVRLALDIARHEPLRSAVTERHQPAPSLDDADDVALLEWIRDTATTIYHPTGTCRMGVDDGAVLDPQLRVRGVAGLRVADCSVMPEIVSGNTNAPAIMIGEKASDMILEAASEQGGRREKRAVASGFEAA